MFLVRLHRYDCARLAQNRYGVIVAIQIKHTPAQAVIDAAGKEIDPDSLRKPFSHMPHLRTLVIFFSNRSDNHLIAKPILIFHIIGASAFGMGVIHRHNQRLALGMCPIIHGVKIREQLMT